MVYHQRSGLCLPVGLPVDSAAQMGAHLEGLVDLLAGQMVDLLEVHLGAKEVQMEDLQVVLVGHLVDLVVRLAAQRVE